MRVAPTGRRIARTVPTRVGRVVFGDRVGLVVFLTALAVYACYWRIGVFLTDTYTVANGLAAVLDGHLWVAEATVGDSLTSPGMHVSNGRLYARNYGQIVLAVPFAWLLRGVTAVASLPTAIAVGWSALLGLLADRVGALLGRRRTCRRAGLVAATVALVGNLALATPVDTALLPLLALQLQAMVAAALTGVLCYRLLARAHDRRVGTVAGAVTALATPVGFWAVAPKRHALGALAVVAVTYAFYRSRRPDAPEDAMIGPRGFRALAYAVVGLWTWVHAAEGLVLVTALLLADLPTAPYNDPRTLALAAGAFLLSLVPFLVTNALVSGDPLVPMRMLDPARSVPPTAGDPGTAPTGTEPTTDTATPTGTEPTTDTATPTSPGGTAGAEGGSRGTATGDGGSGLAAALGSVLASALEPFGQLATLAGQSIAVAVEQPERVLATFVKSGTVEWGGSDLQEASNLSLLESVPLAGGLFGAVVGWAVAARGRVERSVTTGPTSVRVTLRRVRTDQRRSTDAFVAFVVVGFALLFQWRLPTHAQITVRYLHPVVPLLVYAVARTRVVRASLGTASPTAYRAWGLGVGFGLLLVVDAIVLLNLELAAAMQLHAWLSLAAAGTLATAVAARPWHGSNRAVAVALGLAAAATTVFLLVSGLDYFDYVGEYALPVVRLLTDSIRLV